jgi:hypothetical protein
MHSMKALFAASFAVLALLTSCGQRRDTSGTTSDTAAHPVTSSPTDTSTSAWVAEVRQGEAELEQIVEQGRLSEVHDQAHKLQATLKMVADHADNLTTEQRQQLTEHLVAADRLVDELHDAGDAGDLTKVKAKLQEFKTHLRGIEGVFGVTAP